MEIREVRHKGLRRFVERGDRSGLPAGHADKIRRMLSFLQDAADIAELKNIPAWHAHMLTGARKDTWSLHVSPNWRMTLRVEGEAIVLLDLEDYH